MGVAQSCPLCASMNVRLIASPMLISSELSRSASTACLQGHRRERQPAPLSRQQIRLRWLRAETTLLPKEPARKVPRSTLEGARDVARDIATDAYNTSRHALP